MEGTNGPDPLTVARRTSAASALTENALFMSSWPCFSINSAAFVQQNNSAAASWAVVTIGPSVAGIIILIVIFITTTALSTE
jgi:hypothetical protein